jgi:hypothetical protein
MNKDASTTDLDTQHISATATIDIRHLDIRPGSGQRDVDYEVEDFLRQAEDFGAFIVRLSVDGMFDHVRPTSGAPVTSRASTAQSPPSLRSARSFRRCTARAPGGWVNASSRATGSVAGAARVTGTRTVSRPRRTTCRRGPGARRGVPGAHRENAPLQPTGLPRHRRGHERGPPDAKRGLPANRHPRAALCSVDSPETPLSPSSRCSTTPESWASRHSTC